jgi:glycolate oxidase iron-sulfur subunit
MKAVAFNECIHCGFCLEACPTYDVLGTELDSPRGRLYLMRALEEGSIAPTEPVVRHIDLCLGCRACETECPSGVPYGHHLEEARRTLRASPHRPGGERWIESLLLRAVAMPPGLQKPAATLLAALQRIGLFGLIARSPRMNAAREQADAATRSSRLRGGARLLASAKLSSRSLPTVTPARGERRRRVGFLEGCVNRWVFGHVNEAGARLLSRAGCEVVAPPGQRCCGALHLHAGDIDGARRLARKNIAAFEAAEVFGAGKVSAGGETGEESVGGAGGGGGGGGVGGTPGERRPGIARRVGPQRALLARGESSPLAKARMSARGRLSIPMAPAMDGLRAQARRGASTRSW